VSDRGFRVLSRALDWAFEAFLAVGLFRGCRCLSGNVCRRMKVDGIYGR
jgi:hypothetical protein